MNLKDLNIEKIALALLVIFVFVLFIDYTFNISVLISKFYQLDINTEQRRKLLMLVSISIVPILYFLSKFSFYRKENNKLVQKICKILDNRDDIKDEMKLCKEFVLKLNNEPDIMVTSLLPFLAFIIGFYLSKLDFFSSAGGLFLIMFIQIILLLTIFTTLEILLSKIIIGYKNINIKIFKKKT